MKLSEWAKKVGISYRRAWQLFKDGKLPNAYKLPSGTIIVEVEEESKPSRVEGKVVAIYCRVCLRRAKRKTEKIVKDILQNEEG